ncbi:hypothetical protein KIK84_07370 [Curvibacter sp. CHRR-16]|uniref:hypothetical protein n=1 Tax=Curvibacter sp. CHRR-16 TaxID=2835872 RepID=UPI001BD9CDE5|nr:hypothetical protein [Curvibacter sp. CHRR-16]MBT0570139.1 hypothetical protein [Curvibacter sp. CHRR-16]
MNFSIYSHGKKIGLTRANSFNEAQRNAERQFGTQFNATGKAEFVAVYPEYNDLRALPAAARKRH